MSPPELDSIAMFVQTLSKLICSAENLFSTLFKEARFINLVEVPC